MIADKENQLQDSRVTVTQHQNAHADTKRNRDSLSAALTQTQQALDTEAAARVDLQTLVNQLREKLNFQQQVHEKVCCDMTLNKIFSQVCGRLGCQEILPVIIIIIIIIIII